MPSYIDRTRVLQEIQNNPALLRRLAEMTKGEVGLGSDVRKEIIQTESALNRAMSRGIPLSQALRAVNEGKGGYYASNTYRGISPSQLEYFNKNIMPSIMSGSNVGGDTLGFAPTGNASQMDFAGKRAEKGVYGNYKWYSGKPGVGEMFVTERPDMRWAQNQGLTNVANRPVPLDANGNPIATPLPQGVTLNTPPQMPPVAGTGVEPAQVAPTTATPEPTMMSKFNTALMGQDNKAGAGSGAAGLETIAAGLRPKIDPQAAAAAMAITPISSSVGGGGGAGGGASAQAQALLSAVMANRRKPMGLTLTGGLA